MLLYGNAFIKGGTKMRILHIGWGFTPWRGGGLIEYAEDLMREQVQHRYSVFYFCSGRHYPFFKGTRLKCWVRDGYTIFEVINPPIYHGGDRGTIWDIESPVIENLFDNIVDRIKPDIIHIQELAGLPSSVIDIINSKRIPVVMTLHDYFLLCPTLKLFDFEHKNCILLDPAARCVHCVDTLIDNKWRLILQTIRYEIGKMPIISHVSKRLYKVFGKMVSYGLKYLSNDYTNRNENREELIRFFGKRRTINIDRLKKVDLLIAPSKRVQVIYQNFLDSCNNIVVLHLTLRHLEHIRPKKVVPGKIINFGTLNGFASVAKGALVLLDALKILQDKGLDGKFRLHVFGGLMPEIKDNVLGFRNVVYHGYYTVGELDQILDIVDVGIVPSVWEEVYGFVGVEFLAKGIPIIGNNRGGIVDYTIDDFTGWVNKTCTSEELAKIMEEIICQPERVVELNEKIITNRGRIVKSMERHFYEMDAIYKETIRRKKYAGS